MAGAGLRRAVGETRDPGEGGHVGVGLRVRPDCKATWRGLVEKGS